MRWARSLTPSEKVVWAWRLPRSHGISGALSGGRWVDGVRSSSQGDGAERAGGGPSQVIEKPSANQPLTSFHVELPEAPTGVLGDTQPAKPMRPLEVGVSRGRDSGPKNAGSCCTWPPAGNDPRRSAASRRTARAGSHRVRARARLAGAGS